MPELLRWNAKIKYRLTHDTTQTTSHDVEEIEDLQDIVERGPNFYAIEEIVIRPNITSLLTTLAEADSDVPNTKDEPEPRGDQPTGAVIDFPTQKH